MNRLLKRFRSNLSGDIPLSLDDPLLRAKEVKRNFLIQEKTITVLEQVDFEINPKETIAITGASGSGKSTLLNLLAGIDSPTQGEVFFYQYPLSELSESQLALLRIQYIGFVFQEHNLIKELTVLENVLLPSMLRYSSVKTQKEKTQLALDLLSKVGLENRIDHYVGELSGGEAQRSAIVRAFINHPKLILADEPTGNLDRENSLDVFSLLKNFAETQSTAVIMVTHSQELAKQCSRTYTIEKGILIGSSVNSN